MFTKGENIDMNYITEEIKFRVPQNSQTNYKNVAVMISHKTLPSITDTMIISAGL